ncbi:MAG: HD domain-containing phosphohydrolase [Candidatus Omnitrophota bacterium]
MRNRQAFHKGLDALSKIKTINELFIFMEDRVVSFFELTHLNVLILNDSETKYTCIKNIAARDDIPEILKGVSFSLNDYIAANLLDNKEAVSTKEVDKSLKVVLTEKRRVFLLSLRDRLDELKSQACIPGFINGKLFAIFLLGEKLSKEAFSIEELELFSLIANKSAEIIYNFNLLEKEIRLFTQSICETNARLELKDHYTMGHSHRVERFSMIMSEKLQDELDKIPHGRTILYYAAEFAKLLKPMEKWFGKIILEAVLCHHENYDGTGYPCGKKREEINILARIIRVADSFDAMISGRTYRKSLVQHKALLELKNNRGTQFDPKVVDAFLEAYKEGLFADIFSQMLNISKE